MRTLLCGIALVLSCIILSSCKKNLDKKSTNELDIIGASPDQIEDVDPLDSALVFSNVFVNNENGYRNYRIPAIVKVKNSTILAFIEGRVNNVSDFGKINILVKRSIDKGKTWSTSKVIATNGDLQVDDPVPIVDYTDPAYPNGRVFLFYCTGNRPEDNVRQLDGVKEVWYITSSDYGATWSSPKNITLQVHHPYQPTFNAKYTDTLKWGYYATGPGHGLQLTQGPHKGRLVIPINHSVYKKGNYSSIFYSDDHGKSFHLSADVAVQSGEATAAELSDGSILLNSRNQYLPGRNRILSYELPDTINGESRWSSSFNTFLIEPVCEGSMINYTNLGKEKVILFSNPASIYGREKLSIKQSKDFGKKWSKPFLIDQGQSAYSDMVILNQTRMGVLYEGDNNKTIKFCSFDYRMLSE